MIPRVRFTLAAAFALVASAPAQSELDELIRRTNELKSFTASYTTSTSKDSERARVRIDYSAPSRVRVELSGGKVAASYWCVDDVYALTVAGEQPAHARLDYKLVRAHLAELERKLIAEFPACAARRGTPGALVSMRWWFDDKEQKANYNFEAAVSDDRTVLLGWLATLRSKKTELVREGELLTFKTDADRFRGTLSPATGFLVDWWGTSPNGEMHIHLDELALDQPVDAARFALPTATAGRDVSDDLLRSFTGGASRELRARVHRALASDAGAPWDEAARAKIERALREFHLVAVADALKPWRESAAKKRDGTAEHLRKLAATKTPEEIAVLRDKERGYLKKNLENLRSGFEARLLAPDGTADLPRSAELLALELAVVLRVFDETVRDPVTADFERALASDG